MNGYEGALMFQLPKRAPISYEVMRRPFNVLRISGALAFVAAAAIGYGRTGDVAPLVLTLPALVVVGDSIYRLRTDAPAFPGLMVDATALFGALALRGPSTSTSAVVMMYLLVASALLLPMAKAVVVVGYSFVLWVLVSIVGSTATSGPIGAIDRAGFGVGFDRVMVGVLIISVAVVMLGAINALLRSQDQQSEALAQERRAVELKNEFVSMVSHELRTPLTGIAGFTDTLSDTWESLPTGEVDEFLSIMRRETDHLTNLVEDILVIPRLEAGQLRLDPAIIDLAVETQAVVAMIRSESADFSVSIPSGVLVYADKTRLRQILRNLLENADKYGGDQVLIEGELSGPGQYTVSVSDNGTGINLDNRERIFQHFEQLSTGDARQEQGVGLGLPIARKLARAMGGDLWYEDRFPMGSNFKFIVTLAGSEHAATVGSADATAPF
jgi:signal transduction histidine kinase